MKKAKITRPNATFSFSEIQFAVITLLLVRNFSTMELEIIKNKIYEIRGQRVMLDRDLAQLYGVETKVLNQAVRRNLERFPEDFMFELTKAEANLLEISSRSQIVTLNKGRGATLKYAPLVFTEQGVAMLSSVLRSSTAIQVNISIMRAFVTMIAIGGKTERYGCREK